MPTVQLSGPAAPEDEEGVLGLLRFAPLTNNPLRSRPRGPLRGRDPRDPSVRAPKKVIWQDDGEALRTRCGVRCGPRA